jgi:hypothetical protein
MKALMTICFLLALCATGCVTKATANARAHAAFIAGQQQGAAAQLNEVSVWVVGNVRTPVLPWTAELTLAKAIAAADYQGTQDPGTFVIQRNGRAPQYVSLKQILDGYDMPLEPGDRIEIRP